MIRLTWTALDRGLGSKRLACAYWHEGAREWRGEGLEAAQDGEGSLVCASDHLTVFAVLLERLQDVVLCSNAQVLSAEGFRAVARPTWMARPAAFVLWGLLLLQVLFAAWVSCRYGRLRREMAWDDMFLFTNHEDLLPHSSPGLAARLRQLCQLCTCSNTIHQAVARGVVMKIIAAWHASKLNIRTDEATLLATWARTQLDDQTVAPAVSKTTVESGVSATKSVVEAVLTKVARTSSDLRAQKQASFVQRFRVLFLAMQPWLQLQSFSVKMSSQKRALRS